MMTLPFNLPTPSNMTGQVIWSGAGFSCGEQIFPVLEYSENFSGWSDDLTALHEEAAGDTHPIDLASRNDAIIQVGKLVTKPAQVIMEIGCSSGFLLHDLTKTFPDAVVIGADVVKVPLLKLAEDLPSVPLIRFDLLQSPLPNGCVDILVMLNVLEHIEDDVTALRNAFKLLKPGGSLIIEVPAGQYLYDAYDAQLYHFRRYSAYDLQSKLETVGFVVRRKSHLGFLIFPAFAIVKLLNKLKGKSVANVQQQVTRTAGSKVMRLLLKLEHKLSNFMSLPFGVRVLVTAKKPVK